MVVLLITQRHGNKSLLRAPKSRSDFTFALVYLRTETDRLQLEQIGICDSNAAAILHLLRVSVPICEK